MIKNICSIGLNDIFLFHPFGVVDEMTFAIVMSTLRVLAIMPINSTQLYVNSNEIIIICNRKTIIQFYK